MVAVEHGTGQAVIVHVRTTVMELEHPMSVERDSFDNTIEYIKVGLWGPAGIRYREMIMVDEISLYY